MKSEQRHELEKNILADRIGTGIQAARPILPIILGGLAILVIGAFAWGLYSAGAQNRTAVAWTDYYFNLTTSNDPASYFDLTARDADAFLDVADRFPTSPAAAWAQQSAGSRFLEQGIEALYRNRAEGETLLNQAIEAFSNAANSNQPALRTQAHYGLGRAYEAMSQLPEAAEAYEKVIESANFPQLAENARRRLDFVTSQEGKDFYAWFSKLDPRSDAPIRLPGDLSVPPTSPADMSFDPLDPNFGNAFPPLPTGGGQPATDYDPAMPESEPTPPSEPADAPPAGAADDEGLLELSPPSGAAAAEPASSGN
jgi:hypothetical protein